ncbi:MAG TPA: MBL fold metallo-hydrolase [Stellaceae bacterium]|nr:MBL fold metallo-hydrolase [Stellaceae bacterium]
MNDAAPVGRTRAARPAKGGATKPAPVGKDKRAARADFSTTFWGVRGSIPVPGPETLRYGGNTPCVEVRCGGHLLIFDAGTGIRPLGDRLETLSPPLHFDIFLSHTHTDHINGLPFFAPAFRAQNTLRIWAGHLLPEHTIKQVLDTMMSDPLFPIPVDAFAADLAFIDFHPRETLNPHRGVTLRTAPLNHPNRATAYRVDFDGRSVCYVTDTEHFDDRLDHNIVELIRGADIAIYDAMFTNEEYQTRRGWGHSTWEEGLRLADAAEVKTLILFHHAPSRTDDELDRLAEAVDRLRPGTMFAREGMILRP